MHQTLQAQLSLVVDYEINDIDIGFQTYFYDFFVAVL